MKKRKNGKKNSANPQKLEYVLGPEEVLEVMQKGTEVSCELAKALVSTGSGIVGMSAAVYGLAKVTVLLNQLCLRKGYNVTAMYDEVKRFFAEYAQSEDFQKEMERYGL